MKRDPSRAELSWPERALLAHLHQCCRGADRARTYADLRRDLAGEGVSIGQREMYEVVSGLVRKGRLVGTCDLGAFIIVDSSDARIAYRYLYGRVRRQLRRCRALKRTLREGLAGQEYLPLAPMPQDARGQGLLLETERSNA